jgi:hypothetical protein
MAHDQVVMSSNPGTVFLMDVSDLLPIIIKKNKGRQMGHTKKNI